MYCLRSNPIGPHMPSPWEILHNRMDERPGEPSTSVEEDVWNFLIDKKQTQKEQYDERHRTNDLPALQPVQDIYFHSPEGPSDNYISSSIVSRTSEPHSCIVKCQGYQYCHTRHHIYVINLSECCPLQDHHNYHNIPVQSLLAKITLSKTIHSSNP